MTVQAGIECDIVYAVETTLGVPPAAGGTAQKLRKVQSTVAPAAAPFQSNEFASHQQIADLRHGMRSVTGAIDGELSNATYDDWLEAAMRGTWALGGTTIAMSLSAENPANTITRTTGSWITDGFKVGDVVRATGFATTGAANNNVNWRVVTLTALVMTVAGPDPSVTIAAVTAATGVTVAVTGKKLLVGTTKRSFTIEQTYPTIDESEQFAGCRIGGFTATVPPNGMATVSFPIMGLKYARLVGAAAPYFTSPVVETTTNLLAGPTGVVRVAGADTLVATAWQLQLNGNLSNQPVIGSNYAPDIFAGPQVFSGSFSAYMESLAYADAFLNETEIDISMMLNTVDTSPSGFLNFTAQRVKLMGVQKTLTANGGVIATYPFQTLRKIGGAAIVYDTSSLVIQRSN